MIAFVYLAGLLILALAGLVINFIVDLAGQSNFLYLRNPIARERGIAAYRAWLPLGENQAHQHLPASLGRGLCVAAE